MAAKKKYYGVRVGKKTGVFKSWEECRASVEGYPGAEYKGFATLKEAEQYLEPSEDNRKQDRSSQLLAYVDGSYHDGLKCYAFGCVFILPDGRIYTEFGNGSNPQSLQHRNVTGEMLGAMFAVKTAMLNGYQEIEICYDYEGIEKWVTGAWRSKTECTQKYAASMREWGKSIHISFTKVLAHSNIRFNELADKKAKQGLTEGQGIPKIRRLEEMEQWNG
ncbi:MAG: ribonuclease H family protein [Roseburia sp.]|nr:ribonuclease H family protein [Roseburia sp.]